MSDINNQAIPQDQTALEALLPPKATVRREADREEAQAPRTRRRTNLGGMRLKLSVGNLIEGYHMYWANDENNEVQELLEEGFTYVKPSEVRMERGLVADTDVSDRVSKYVGTKANGDPLRAYLMKCPQDLWDEIQEASQEQANAWDSAILAGTVGGVDSRYDPKGTSRSIGRFNSPR